MEPLTLSRNELKAISSDKRMEILKLLNERRHTLSELSGRLGIRLPSTKEHLQKLEKAELIAVVDSGHKWKYYALTGKARKLFVQESTFLLLFSLSFIALIASTLLLFSFNFAGLQMASKASSMAPALASIQETALGAGISEAAEMPKTAVQEMPQVTGIDLSQLVLVALIAMFGIASIYFYKRFREKREKPF